MESNSFFIKGYINTMNAFIHGEADLYQVIESEKRYIRDMDRGLASPDSRELENIGRFERIIETMVAESTPF